MAACLPMATLSPESPRRGNRGFVNAARNFVKRARGLPGFPMLLIGGGAGVVLATITGAFGTNAFQLGTRFAFWAVLIGWNVVKWTAWFAWRVREQRDWRRAALIGSIAINIWLPLEIPLALWLFGVSSEVDPGRIWLEALGISATLFVILFFTGRRPSRPRAHADKRILFRAGVRELADIHAVRAEDHYCRLHLADGRSLLILARFADVLAELGDIDGEQVHRGAWVAAAGVDGAVRDGRAWRLLLRDGTRLPVSASYAACVRQRGWLRIKPTVGPKLG